MISWFAEAQCDALDANVGGRCENKTEVTLTLKARRVIEIEVPSDWVVRYQGNDDSQRDSNHVDLDGDDVRVYCPKHKTSRY